MPKRRLREEFLKARRDLSESEWRKLSFAIQERAIENIPWERINILGLYANRGREVDTSMLFAHAKKESKIMAFPRVANAVEIEYHKVSDISELVLGGFALLEPPILSYRVPISDIDLFVIPGLVFDESGARIGYGRGYFDRVLRGVERSKILALAFDRQVTKSIPHESHDVRVGCIVTESRVIKF